MSRAMNKRDTYEKTVYKIWDVLNVPHIQLTRYQGADNITIGLYPQIVEVKNSNIYKLTDAELAMKERVEAVGGKYWIVYDDETAQAVAHVTRGDDVKIPY